MTKRQIKANDGSGLLVTPRGINTLETVRADMTPRNGRQLKRSQSSLASFDKNGRQLIVSKLETVPYGYIGQGYEFIVLPTTLEPEKHTDGRTAEERALSELRRIERRRMRKRRKLLARQK